MLKNNVKIKLLAREDIDELSQKKEANGLAFSLYLGIKAGRNFVSEANSVISGAIKKIGEDKSYSKREERKISEIANEMKKDVRLLKLPDKSRSIVMFYNAKRKIGIYHVPVYTPSRFVIENDFYIHPFIKALQKNPRYLVVFLERDRARFFSISLGEIEKVSEIICETVPQRINAARVDWKGLSETRIQGHIQDHEKRHLKKTAKKTEDYLRYAKESFNYLIIGTRKELLEKFIGILSAKSKEKLAGFYYIAHGYDLNRIKTRSAEVIDEYEKKVEEKIVNDLFGRSSKKKAAAVLGVNFVLENFYLHNINMIVISKDYEKEGYVCPKCHYISSYLRLCSRCKSKMLKASDIADEIMEEAIANKIKIKHLFYGHKEFDKFGIGAVLKTGT